jgi:hypothetical protein
MRATPFTLLRFRFPSLPGIDPPRISLRVPFEFVPVLAQVCVMDMKVKDAETADARTIKSSDEDEKSELSDS